MRMAFNLGNFVFIRFAFCVRPFISVSGMIGFLRNYKIAFHTHRVNPNVSIQIYSSCSWINMLLLPLLLLQIIIGLEWHWLICICMRFRACHQIQYYFWVHSIQRNNSSYCTKKKICSIHVAKWLITFCNAYTHWIINCVEQNVWEKRNTRTRIAENLRDVIACPFAESV